MQDHYDAWPETIDYDPATKTLHVTFEGGEIFALSAEYLRVESPSAEVQGHSPSQKQAVGGKRNVGIRRIEPVGIGMLEMTTGNCFSVSVPGFRMKRPLLPTRPPSAPEGGTTWRIA